VPWLVGVLVDASLKKLTTLVFGSEQDRALRQASVAAVQQTVDELSPAGGKQAGQLAAAITKAFKTPMPKSAPAGNATLLEVLQEGIAKKLAVLDAATLAGTGQSSADLPGVSAVVLAEKLGTRRGSLTWHGATCDHRAGPVSARGSAQSAAQGNRVLVLGPLRPFLHPRRAR